MLGINIIRFNWVKCGQPKRPAPSCHVCDQKLRNVPKIPTHKILRVCVYQCHLQWRKYACVYFATGVKSIWENNLELLLRGFAYVGSNWHITSTFESQKQWSSKVMVWPCKLLVFVLGELLCTVKISFADKICFVLFELIYCNTIVFSFNYIEKERFWFYQNSY